jgi:hypothetical protein
MTRKFYLFFVLTLLFCMTADAQKNPFLGRWDITGQSAREPTVPSFRHYPAPHPGTTH